MTDSNEGNPYLAGIYAATSLEADFEDLIVEGELPADLEGAYVRNGPNPKYAPRGRYHWFDGDGMVHSIRFGGGRASYRNRWVRTAHLAEEEAAGKSLWTGLLHSVADNPKHSPYKDSANTDILLYGKELIATWYLCGLPYRVNPASLETLGAHDFGSSRPRRISAHSKVDPRTGELMFFSYGPKPSLAYGVVSAEGRLVHTTDIPLPGPRLPHDMAITERYSILMDLPVFFTEDAVRQQRWRTKFHRDIPARFAVVPRHGSADSVRWFEAEPCYVYHTVNAWEEGDEVVMIACRNDDPLPAPNHERDGAWANVLANLRMNARLHCWRFNLATGETREHTIDDRNTEFPTLNMGRLGTPTRYAYNVSIAEAPTLVFDGIVKYDTLTGASQSYAFGPGRYGSEAVFAPRNGRMGTESHGSSDEDDGYVIVFVGDQRDSTAEVVVLDAKHVAAGPLARVRIPQRVPAGFHACWVPGNVL